MNVDVKLIKIQDVFNVYNYTFLSLNVIQSRLKSDLFRYMLKCK